MNVEKSLKMPAFEKIVVKIRRSEASIKKSAQLGSLKAGKPVKELRIFLAKCSRI